MKVSDNQNVRMPVVFVGHGNPMNALESNEFTEGWKNIAQEMPVPRAILSLSAHWETAGTRISTQPSPKTIHDFGGFPDQLYRVSYPAPGDPVLANSMISELNKSELIADDTWGIDHGTWSVLRHMYPDARIPVLQMSLDYRKTPEQHYNLAKELSFLRKQGVLIFGSGNIVHNLRMVDWSRPTNEHFGFDWALEADRQIKELILSKNHRKLIRYQELGSEVKLSVPTPDHYIPLLYLLGLQEEDEQALIFNDNPVMGSLTMTSVKIG